MNNKSYSLLLKEALVECDKIFTGILKDKLELSKNIKEKESLQEEYIVVKVLHQRRILNLQNKQSNELEKIAKKKNDIKVQQKAALQNYKNIDTKIQHIQCFLTEAPGLLKDQERRLEQLYHEYSYEINESKRKMRQDIEFYSNENDKIQLQKNNLCQLRKKCKILHKEVKKFKINSKQLSERKNFINRELGRLRIHAYNTERAVSTLQKEIDDRPILFEGLMYKIIEDPILSNITSQKKELEKINKKINEYSKEKQDIKNLYNAQSARENKLKELNQIIADTSKPKPDSFKEVISIELSKTVITHQFSKDLMKYLFDIVISDVLKQKDIDDNTLNKVLGTIQDELVKSPEQVSMKGIALRWLQNRWGLEKLQPYTNAYKEIEKLTKTIKQKSEEIEKLKQSLEKQIKTQQALSKKVEKIIKFEEKEKQKQIEQTKEERKSIIEKFENDTEEHYALISRLDNQISKLEKLIKEESNRITHNFMRYIRFFSVFSQKLNSPKLFQKEVEKYCNTISIGNFVLNIKTNNDTTLPFLIDFPIQYPIYFGKEKKKNIILNFVLQMILSVPLKQLSITVFDPLELGNSLGDLKLLLPYKQLFPAGHVLTRAGEIEDELDQHVRYIENLNQAVFKTPCNDWDSYNKQNPQRQLPYKLLIIYDFPESFSDRSISYLSKLLRHGPKCGVLPLIVANTNKLSQDKRLGSFLPEFNEYCCNIADLFKVSNNLELKSLQLTEAKDSSLTPQEYQSIITQISDKLSMISKNDTLAKPVNTDLWRGNATECISASIGRNAKDNSDTLLAFGDAPNTIHALLGGKTGSGKSNLLHVLINSLCFKYSPEEFQLYLLDYKDGIEFNFYANPVLPHARLVATQSDVEYGFTVLRHLEEERSRRMEMFKDVSVADYKSYRKKTGNKLPRILVIIDEFQRLFEGDSRSANEIKELLTSLLRLSRAAGIHFLLATQSIRGGLQHMTFVGMLNHLTGRIALSCTQEDSAAILSIGNDAAAELQSPPEAILNNSNGMKSANIRFSVPFAEPEYRQNLLEQLNLCAKKENLELQNTVFQGDILPKVPNSAEFRTACDKLGLSLLLGKKHHFLGENFCTNISRGNLLIAGYDWNLRRGLLHSIFYSLKSLPQKPAILYLNSDEEMILSPSAQIEGPNFVYKDGSWNGSDLNDFIAKDGEKIIIIDSFDYARAFHSKGTTMSLPFGRTQGPPSPFELLCDIADPISAIQDVHILLFVEDYERFSSSAKQLLGHFDLRIGFGMDEDQAGRFIKPGSGAKKFPGIENSQKAVFVDCKRNKQFLIRPFILPE